MFSRFSSSSPYRSLCKPLGLRYWFWSALGILFPRYPPYLASFPLSATWGGTRWETSSSSRGMITLPITKQAQEQERDKILTITQNSRFTKHTIHNLRKKLSDNNKKKPLGDKQQITQGEDKKWITFTYRSPLIRKITNLFKQTNLNITFKSTNTIYNTTVIS